MQGRKSELEKFAGALFTTSVEGFVPATGKGVQVRNSHTPHGPMQLKRQGTVTSSCAAGLAAGRVTALYQSSTAHVGTVAVCHSSNRRANIAAVCLFQSYEYPNDSYELESEA